MKYKIFIDGEQGTTGLKIYDDVSKREDVELLKLPGEKRKDLKHRLEMIGSAHVSFLCLPDHAAKEIATLAPKEAKLIDTSTAHRTKEDWVYGLPELEKGRREMIRNSKRIAVPGCHATGMILLMRPLVDEGFISKSSFLTATSLTGYSGGGKKMIAAYRSDSRPSAYESPAIYALEQDHKHLDEIRVMTGMEISPAFLPIVGNYYSGMAVTLPIHREALTKRVGKGAMTELFRTRYEKEALIKVVDTPVDKGFIYGNEMAGRNDVIIYISGNDERITLSAVYDNLGKGASGAAIQNMNILLGIEETGGLI